MSSLAIAVLMFAWVLVSTIVAMVIARRLPEYLVLELDQPFGGIIRVSDAPLHTVMAHLGE